ncbi:uncharacterized protein LOC126841244 [Adelges cooleyi]|uniref:uncharacterized protein LOC126841244 n=1 Tax=Adelges cooleyi TaxID=133065 RepID=UPI00217FC7FC|nr:uncharacterized protein LOC126841244 [Adelges cooleyi]
MKWSKILFIIVLNFAVLKCGSAQPLITGYTYNTEDNDQNINRISDLKCGYLFRGLTQMRLINLVFSPPVSSPSKALELIRYHKDTVKYMISTLYLLDRTNLSTLWLLQLYTNMLLNYYDFILKHVETPLEHHAPKIIETHMYVIKKMQKFAGNCRKNNIYDSESEYVTNPGLTYESILKLFVSNDRDFMEMMKLNSNISSINVELLSETMRPKRLLMNNLGINAEFKTDLMMRYHVQVNWGDTSNRLYNAYYSAYDMDWTTNNLRKLVAYYTLHIDFLKFIMYQLILKHFMGSEKIKVGPFHLLIALDNFQNRLNLNDDEQINELKVAINTYGKSKSDKHECLLFIKSYLQVAMQKICESLGCLLIEPIPLNVTELSTPSNGHEEIYVQCLVSEVTIVKVDVDYYLEHLNYIFAHVSFEAIKLIIQYIREINQ